MKRIKKVNAVKVSLIAEDSRANVGPRDQKQNTSSWNVQIMETDVLL